QCNTGNLQCCQHTADASDPVTGLLLGLLGIVVEAVDGLIGISCSPISIVGLGSGSACNASPVCCENNTFTGLIVIGCVPINI
ncbi:fungal hydrophobin, partial [Punctularia strigosozonata HHB-11173 SS5]|uniref:fungal hydrophobin n=1 Tax=Punctularia strigosozonata (strain HHB-11173) TaxID=741275 RepID=UPI00044186A8